MTRALLLSTLEQKISFLSIYKQSNISISSVTSYELYIGATTIEKADSVNTILQGIEILPFTDSIAVKAA